MTKIPRKNNLEEIKVIGSSISEVSLLRGPTPVLWAKGKATHHARRAQLMKAAQQMVGSGNRESEEAAGKMYLYRVAPVTQPHLHISHLTYIQLPSSQSIQTKMD